MQGRTAVVNGKIVTSSKGDKYPIVHQYDRYPDLQKGLFSEVNAEDSSFSRLHVFQNNDFIIIIVIVTIITIIIVIIVVIIIITIIIIIITIVFFMIIVAIIIITYISFNGLMILIKITNH